VAATAGGVVAHTEIYRASDHSVCGAKVGFAEILLMPSHPSSRGGESCCSTAKGELANMFRNQSLKILILASAVALVLIFGTFAAQQQAQGPAQQPPPVPTPAVLQNYKPVTAERLKNPEPGDWLMVRRTYDGWGYSPLDQISTKNVERLQPVWSFSTGVVSGHEAPPIVNNGVMFVATPSNQVIAIDVRTGKLLWRFRRPAPEGANIPHQTSRGVALYGDKVFFAVGEAVLIAIEAKTGKEVWATKIEENKNGYYTTMAPLVADGKV